MAKVVWPQNSTSRSEEKYLSRKASCPMRATYPTSETKPFSSRAICCISAAESWSRESR